jgi:hypothetical protein
VLNDPDRQPLQTVYFGGGVSWAQVQAGSLGDVGHLPRAESALAVGGAARDMPPCFLACWCSLASAAVVTAGAPRSPAQPFSGRARLTAPPPQTTGKSTLPKPPSPLPHPPPQTPSLVPPHLLARILDALRRRYGLARGAEVSIEADPGTFDAGLLAEYKQLGFTRLSVGVQSFQEVCFLGAAGSRRKTSARCRERARSRARVGFWIYTAGFPHGSSRDSSRRGMRS